MNAELVKKRDHLLAVLKRCESVAVAFSGGVDSVLVAQAALLALGDDAVAVTAVSPSLASGELQNAKSVARRIGIRHELIETDEFSIPGYEANAGNRCYFCKTELYSGLEALLPKLNVRVICNGANCDDQGDHRPGMIAAGEHAVRSPLIEAGFTKQDVRELAQAWQLPVWDKPASPCLSSRIAYGVQVTPERVERVDQAEQFLRDAFSMRELRVRLEANELARIEVPLNELQKLATEEGRLAIVTRFRELGFRYVTLDLEGFRSGSLNAALPLVALDAQHPAVRQGAP